MYVLFCSLYKRHTRHYLSHIIILFLFCCHIRDYYNSDMLYTYIISSSSVIRVVMQLGG